MNLDSVPPLREAGTSNPTSHEIWTDYTDNLGFPDSFRGTPISTICKLCEFLLQFQVFERITRRFV